MTSYQSELSGGGDVAEELAKGQRAISIAEFFEKNKHMLGFDSGARGLVTAVKEAVDNALDATEEAGILPDVYVEIAEAGDYYRLVIEDNGPGITREQIPKVFGKLLYGSRFHAREQSRGQQGIGISAAVLYSQLTSGKPAKITSKTQGDTRAQYFELIIDTDTNEPEISVEDTTTWERTHGTRIELEMEANMRARQQLHDYVKHTAVVNPHARIEFREPSEHLKYERATDQLPAETKEIRPHPHGVELGTLIKMLGATDSYSVSGFLQSEFTRVGQKTAESVVANFRDRHFGREMAWSPPASNEDADVAAAITDAVNGKGKDLTAAFVEAVTKVIDSRERISHHELVGVVDNGADRIEEEEGVTFGDTVRENAVEAAWREVLASREADCFRLVDDATTNKKDDAAVEALARRIATAFANNEDGRDRVTHATLRGFVERAAERTKEREEVSFGETARDNIVETFWVVCRTVPDDAPSVTATEADRDTASELLEAMRETDILSPPTDCLAPITDELVLAGLRKEYDADFYAAATRDAEVHGGDPFIVEAGIAYGGDLPAEGPVDVLRFANRVPLVYQRGACASTDVIKRINWRNYGLDQPGGSGMPNGPAVLMIHVASTNVPFTSESKDAIANVPGIEDEIELALREAAREMKRYLNKRRSMEKRRHKQDVIADILPRMAEKLSEVTQREALHIGDSLARIMNNVLVERSVEEGHVTVAVRNFSETNANLDVTDILDAAPGDIVTRRVTGTQTEPDDPPDPQVVEMDGEWFVKWSPTVAAGDTAILEYDVSDGTTFDISVEGLEDEKLTVNA